MVMKYSRHLSFILGRVMKQNQEKSDVPKGPLGLVRAFYPLLYTTTNDSKSNFDITYTHVTLQDIVAITGQDIMITTTCRNMSKPNLASSNSMQENMEAINSLNAECSAYGCVVCILHLLALHGHMNLSLQTSSQTSCIS